jgi:hypothetical protein
MGRYELTYIRYLEDSNGDVRIVKEWYADRIVTTTIDVSQGKIDEVVEEVNGLGRIPAVCVYN